MAVVNMVDSLYFDGMPLELKAALLMVAVGLYVEKLITTFILGGWSDEGSQGV